MPVASPRSPDAPRPWHRPLVRGLASLTGVQLLGLALPLVTLPFLTRVLGLEAWGEVAAALALGNLAATIPEYGFGVTATRRLAQDGYDEAFTARFVATVVRAKGVLAVGAAGLVVAVQAVDRAALASPGLVAGAVCIAVGHGLWMAWYFEGAEKGPQLLGIVALARLGYAAALVAVVRGPGEAAWVPVLYGLSGLAAAGLSLRAMPRRVPGVTAREVGAVLRANAAGFAQRLAVMSYVAGNGFWLSLLAPPDVVGGYGAAEQAVRASALVLVPVSRALYPRYSRVARGEKAAPWMRHARGAMAATGLGLGAAVFAGADLLPVVLGPELAPYVGLVRWLAPLPFLIALSQFSVVQGLLAWGRDGRVAALFALGALVDIGGAFWLVPRVGAVGMAWALLAAEATVACGAFALERHRRRTA